MLFLILKNPLTGVLGILERNNNKTKTKQKTIVKELTQHSHVYSGEINLNNQQKKRKKKRKQ